MLGLVVGKGSTPVDDWFQELGRRHPELKYLLLASDGRLLIAVSAGVIGAALLQRRRRLAVIAAVTPLAGVLAARLGKSLFGRLKEGGLCYPSGHTTVTVVVVAMAVLLAGVTVWAVVVAAAFLALAVIGQAVSYHFFTDAIGALLLGSALVCLALSAARLDRCQPECELGHSGR